MLDLFHGFGSLIEPLISVPSPPFWDSFVNLLEKSLDFLARTFNSAGLEVIVFTIIIKTILLPLTIKSTRSSRAMQDLQPKIKELQKKHGKDRQALSQETMKLYSQYGVNPMVVRHNPQPVETAASQASSLASNRSSGCQIVHCSKRSINCFLHHQLMEHLQKLVFENT